MSTHFKTELEGADDHAKLQSLCKLTYKEQAVWFLNAVWEVEVKGQQGSELAEKLWNYVDKASVIDNAKATGNALDELEAHRFLEAFDEAHTVLQMRSSLRKTGALGQNERPKEVPLTHFLLDKYEFDWHKLVNAPQGDNSAQIAEAQDKLQAVQDAFDASTKADAEAAAALRDAQSKEAEAKASEAQAVAAEDAAKAREAEAISAEDAAKAREADAIAAEDAAKAKEAEAREVEAPFKAACEELEAARKAVQEQEDAYNAKTEELKKASEEGGVVSRNRAKVQLDAHLAEDPLPLRKAKITLEAAQKKADKARAPFQAATEVAAAARAKAEEARGEAEAARKTAEAARAEASAAREAAAAARAEAVANREAAQAAREEAEAAKARAEAAVQAAQDAVAEAEAFLEEVKKNPGSGHGALWWIDRELYEKKKYMPVSKGGVR